MEEIIFWMEEAADSGVKKIADKVAGDVELVTDRRPRVLYGTSQEELADVAERAETVIVPATVGKSRLLEQMEEDALLPDYVGAETAPSAETEALEREELRNLAEQKQILLLALLSLKDTDRELINALFFDGASTREYAQRMGVSQRAVIKRRDRILRDLKKFFENSSK